MKLYVSSDSGQTFILHKDVSWDSTDLAELDSASCSIGLSEYSGLIQIAFAVVSEKESLDDYIHLWIDNIGILYERAVAQDLEVSGITETSLS